MSDWDYVRGKDSGKLSAGKYSTEKLSTGKLTAGKLSERKVLREKFGGVSGDKCPRQS